MWFEVSESNLPAEHVVERNVLLRGQCFSSRLNGDDRRRWWINATCVVVEGVDVPKLHITDTDQWFSDPTIVVRSHPPRFIQFVTLILKHVCCFADVIVAKVRSQVICFRETDRKTERLRKWWISDQRTTGRRWNVSVQPFLLKRICCKYVHLGPVEHPTVFFTRQHEADLVAVAPPAIESVLAGVGLEQLGSASVEVESVVGSEPTGMSPFLGFHIQKI